MKKRNLVVPFNPGHSVNTIILVMVLGTLFRDDQTSISSLIRIMTLRTVTVVHYFKEMYKGCLNII